MLQSNKDLTHSGRAPSEPGFLHRRSRRDREYSNHFSVTRPIPVGNILIHTGGQDMGHRLGQQYIYIVRQHRRPHPEKEGGPYHRVVGRGDHVISVGSLPRSDLGASGWTPVCLKNIYADRGIV